MKNKRAFGTSFPAIHGDKDVAPTELVFKISNPTL